jgi:hypothetical protein
VCAEARARCRANAAASRRYAIRCAASKRSKEVTMRIQVVDGRSAIETTLRRLFDALRSVARNEAEAEVVFETMVNEGRVRVLCDFSRAV